VAPLTCDELVQSFAFVGNETNQRAAGARRRRLVSEVIVSSRKQSILSSKLPAGCTPVAFADPG
jgi:hypothetical protein